MTRNFRTLSSVALGGINPYNNVFDSIKRSTTTIKSSLAKPFISVIDVGPRDGLQNESKILTLDEKAKLVYKLADANITHIEAGSFVNYSKVPQMAGTPELIQRVSSNINTYLSVLVPHVSQMKHLTSRVDEIVLFVSASETFNKKNINTDIDGAFKRFEEIIAELNRTHNYRYKMINIRGSISCCFGCPYEGAVSQDTLKSIIQKYSQLGVDSLDVCDTIGVATPGATEQIVDLFYRNSDLPLSLHMHDTNGKAIDNVMVGINMGVRSVQSSIAGLGGCPFSSKRVGNLDTVKLVERLHQEGYFTGIDLKELKSTSRWVQELLRTK